MKLRNHAVGIMFFGMSTAIGGLVLYLWDVNMND